jgi:hypothetical protein
MFRNKYLKPQTLECSEDAKPSVIGYLIRWIRFKGGQWLLDGVTCVWVGESVDRGCVGLGGTPPKPTEPPSTFSLGDPSMCHAVH